MIDWIEDLIKEIFIRDKHELPDELYKKWMEKTKGLIPVNIGYDSDLIIFHMTVEWSPEAKQWCKENCDSRYVFGHFNINGAVVFFEYESDALAFKLRWA